MASSYDLENNENNGLFSDDFDNLQINHSFPMPSSGSQPPVGPRPYGPAPFPSMISRSGGPATNGFSINAPGTLQGGSSPVGLNLPSGRPTGPPGVAPPSNVPSARPLRPQIDPYHVIPALNVPYGGSLGPPLSSGPLNRNLVFPPPPTNVQGRVSPSQPPTGPPMAATCMSMWGPKDPPGAQPWSGNMPANAYPGSLSLTMPPPSAASAGTPPSSSSPSHRSQWWQTRQIQAPKGTMLPPQNGIMPPSLPDESMNVNLPARDSQPVAGYPMAGLSKDECDQTLHPMRSSSIILYETCQGSRANYPPPATSDYIVRDSGNCSPCYMRCTMNQIPCSGDLLKQSNMPLALILQPLALLHQSEEPTQVVDFGDNGPVRCCRCKGLINETPHDYCCNLGPDGRRLDVNERPELCRGTVDFLVSKEYMVRDPMPAVYFFLIDVSVNAIQSGGTAAACSAVNQVNADLPEGPRTMVGLVTYDSSIQFYNLKRASQQPLMLIVPDNEDVYSPLHTEIVVNLFECHQHLQQLLEDIPFMFQNNNIAESAFGAAIKAAFLAMKTTGGKLLVFQSVLPSVGIGALSSRETEMGNNPLAGEKETLRLLQPTEKNLKEMALELAECQVCVDVFITAQKYVDIASISIIPRTTGGQIYYYYPFSALLDSAKLYNDLRWNITRPQGFEAGCVVLTFKNTGETSADVSPLTLIFLGCVGFKISSLWTTISALLICTGLRTDGRIDDRSYWISRVCSLSVQLSVPLVYPRMMAVHTLVSEEADGSLATPTIPLSSKHLTQDGVFLLENGEDALIFIGSLVNSDILQQLFGMTSEDIPNQFLLQLYHNPLSKKLNDMVNGIRCLRSSYLRLRLCREGETSGMQFSSCMVEDKSPGTVSYVEFLHHIKKEIQVKLSRGTA